MTEVYHGTTWGDGRTPPSPSRTEYHPDDRRLGGRKVLWVSDTPEVSDAYSRPGQQRSGQDAIRSGWVWVGQLRPEQIVEIDVEEEEEEPQQADWDRVCRALDAGLAVRVLWRHGETICPAGCQIEWDPEAVCSCSGYSPDDHERHCTPEPHEEEW